MRKHKKVRKYKIGLIGILLLFGTSILAYAIPFSCTTNDEYITCVSHITLDISENESVEVGFAESESQMLQNTKDSLNKTTEKMTIISSTYKKGIMIVLIVTTLLFSAYIFLKETRTKEEDHKKEKSKNKKKRS